MDDRERPGSASPGSGDQSVAVSWPPVDRGRTDGTGASDPGRTGRDGSPVGTDVADLTDPPTEPFAAASPAPTGPGQPATGDGADRPPGADAGLGSWTFTDALVGLGAVLLTSAVFSAGAQIAVGAGLSRGPWLPLLGLLPVWIGLLGTTIWACRRHGSGSLVTDLGLRLKWSDLAVGIGMAVAGRIASGLIAVLVVSVTRQRTESNLQDLVGPGLGHTGWLIVYTVAIAVVGPIIEEIFFRGLALRSALASLSRSRRPRFATPAARQRFAALLTAGLFAALHLPEVTSLTMLLILIPSLFFFGWMVARWTMWTGRLGGAIVAHIGFNAVAAAALFWGGFGG